MSPEEIAWMAGIVEGEGHIEKRKGSLALWNNDLELLERLHELSGVGTIYTIPLTERRKGYGSRSETYRWMVTRKNDIDALYRLLLPWMMPARRAAMETHLTPEVK